jgi:hypothetical protein
MREAVNAFLQTSRAATAQEYGVSPVREPRAERKDEGDKFGDSSFPRARSSNSKSIAAAVFNLQTDGPVAHTVSTLPFLVDGRLVELDVALFEQHATTPTQEELRHRRLVIALDLSALGHIEVDVTFVGRRAALLVTCDVEEAANELSRHASGLRRTLGGLNWAVDALRYEVADQNTPAPVPRAVFEHATVGERLSLLY